MNRSFLIRHVAATLAIGALTSFGLITGCGGGSSDNPNAGLAQFGGHIYRSTFPLGSRGTATVNMTVQSNGTTTGTATIDNGTPAVASGRAVTRVVVGTGNLTGTVDPVTGAVSLSGNITQDGATTPVTVGGNLNGNSTLGLSGTFYTATWSVFTASPTPGATPSPGATGTGTNQGAFSDLQFSMVSGVNFTSPGTNLKAVSGVVVTQGVPGFGSLVSVTAVDTINGIARSVTVSVFGTLSAGQTLTIDGGQNNVIYSEATPGQTGLPRSYGATGGTVTVSSATANEYKLTLNNVTMAAGPTAQVSSGTGSFTINGPMTGQK